MKTNFSSFDLPENAFGHMITFTIRVMLNLCYVVGKW